MISSLESGLDSFWSNCESMETKLKILSSFNFSQLFCDSDDKKANLHYQDIFKVTYKLFSTGIIFSLAILAIELNVQCKIALKSFLLHAIRIANNFIINLKRVCLFGFYRFLTFNIIHE